jgi:hypothetical protein
MKKYREHVRSLPCYIHDGCAGDVATHHIETGGMGMKCSDLMTVPLCFKHHSEIHQRGRITFANKYGVNPYQFALKILVEFIQQNGIKIEPQKLTRSICQNKLYWLWLGAIREETGNDTEDLHEIFAWKFLPPVLREAMGEMIETRQSTAKLSTAEFAKYLEQIEVFSGMELGIVLPYPEDLYWNALGASRKSK